MATIKSLSPHYKTIPWVSPYTGLTCTSYTLELYAWTGLKTSAPIVPHFTISKNNVTDSTGNDSINISRLLSDFIDFTEQTDAGVTTMIDGNNQAWVKTQVFYTTADTSELTLPQSISVDLMVKGYGYGLEGQNPTIPTNKILIPTNNYKVYSSERFIVPIKLDEHASSLNAANDTFNIYFQDTVLDVLDNDNKGFEPTTIINVTRTDSLPTTAGNLTIENNIIQYNVGSVLATPITATYIIQDSTGDQSTATITVNISALPSTLLAVDDFYTVNNTDVVNLLVQANDSEGTAPTTITAVVQTGLTCGSIAIDGTSEYLIFTPNGSIPTSNETFTYDLTDTLGTDTATVTLQVTSSTTGGGGGSGLAFDMQTTGSATGTISCPALLNSVRYYDGVHVFPTLGDFIYTNAALTTPFAGSNLFYKIASNRSIQVDNSGEVIEIGSCVGGVYSPY